MARFALLVECQQGRWGGRGRGAREESGGEGEGRISEGREGREGWRRGEDGGGNVGGGREDVKKRKGEGEDIIC